MDQIGISSTPAPESIRRNVPAQPFVITDVMVMTTMMIPHVEIVSARRHG